VSRARILESKRDDVGGQRRLVIRVRQDLALRGSMLPESPTCSPFGHPRDPSADGGNQRLPVAVGAISG